MLKEVYSLSELEMLLDNLNRKFQSEHPTLVTIEGPENRGSLTIGLGLDASVLSYVPSSGNPPYLSSVGDSDAEGFVVFHYMGEWSEIPRRHLIPIELAREAVRDFFTTGDLLNKAAWEVD